MKKFLNNISPEKLIISTIVFVAFVVVFVLLGTLKRKLIDKSSNLKDAKNVLVRRLIIAARVFVFIFAVLTISQINGVKIGSVIAGLGILSAVIGLALQDLLKDIITGIHIVSDRFFSIGDVVEYNGNLCSVVGFSLTATKIVNLADNSVVTISNRNISEIRKMSDAFNIDLPLSYEEDATKIHIILDEMAEKIREIKGVKKCVFEGTQSFESSAVLYRIKIFCDPQNRLNINRKANFVIQNELKNNNISIPYNKLDVNIKEEK